MDSPRTRFALVGIPASFFAGRWDMMARETVYGERRVRAVIHRFWPSTRRAWIYVALFAVAFLVLDALALAGVGLAVALLVTLGGAVVGILASYATAYPLIRRLPRTSVWRMVWFFLAFASIYGTIVGGSALVGIPLFPTAEGGNTGAFIYGAAFGFGGAMGAFARGGGVKAAFTGIHHEGDESKSVRRRFVIVISGAVVGLLALCLLGYLAIEYILSPIVRSFA